MEFHEQLQQLFRGSPCSRVCHRIQFANQTADPLDTFLKVLIVSHTTPLKDPGVIARDTLAQSRAYA
jgi:hypothetical protein